MTKVTIGGDRLGSGNKMKVSLRNYGRSTHNLSQDWLSSMTAGVLYPFLCIPAMRGDKFEIDLAAGARTIPTQAPLFGSFKMQMDIFSCPIRLYQGILHNNPIAIGLKMNQVKFPNVTITSESTENNYMKTARFSNNCLLKYLGYSGLPRPLGLATDTSRTINAIPMLAYYDIFKTYYSNKQEEKAYVISPKVEVVSSEITAIFNNGTQGTYDSVSQLWGIGLTDNENNIIIEGKNLNKDLLSFKVLCGIYDSVNEQWTRQYVDYTQVDGLQVNETYTEITIKALSSAIKANVMTLESINDPNYIILEGIAISVSTDTWNKTEALTLNPFKLSNIDDMRNALLSNNTLGSAYNVNDFTKLPYKANYTTNTDGVTLNTYPLNGLCVKTYQSDMFNNWVQTEWIDGENGIAELTKVAVTDGAFKIDSLNMAEKLYNVLNRIAVSGNTYEDWQTAVWEEIKRKHIESPTYHGGLSTEVVFEEVVQTAPGAEEPLGTLGGRGVLVKRKGGNVTVKCDEACFIIGIISITPRLNYTQGNEWYLTELESMDDLHKPALDGIGFQNLIGETMAWFDTCIDASSNLIRHSIGKVPAWINYMSAVDKAYGDFAQDGDKNYMVLSRQYEPDEGLFVGIKDATTYIDPKKYNYAFAYEELESQNFWVKVESKIKARRLMSAKQIPNI